MEIESLTYNKPSGESDYEKIHFDNICGNKKGRDETRLKDGLYNWKLHRNLTTWEIKFWNQVIGVEVSVKFTMTEEQR